MSDCVIEHVVEDVDAMSWSYWVSRLRSEVEVWSVVAPCDTETLSALASEWTEVKGACTDVDESCW